MRQTAKRIAAVLMLSVPIIGLVSLSIASLVPPARSRPAIVWFDVASVWEIPVDGLPLRRIVLKPTRNDAWMRQPDRPVCSVFLRRDPMTSEVSALLAEHHSHFRIPVEYDNKLKRYVSCCWNVAFDLKGQEVKIGKTAQMGDQLPNLPLRVINDRIWVRIEPFRGDVD